MSRRGFRSEYGSPEREGFREWVEVRECKEFDSPRQKSRNELMHERGYFATGVEKWEIDATRSEEDLAELLDAEIACTDAEVAVLWAERAYNQVRHEFRSDWGESSVGAVEQIINAAQINLDEAKTARDELLLKYKSLDESLGADLFWNVIYRNREAERSGAFERTDEELAAKQAFEAAYRANLHAWAGYRLVLARIGGYVKEAGESPAGAKSITEIEEDIAAGRRVAQEARDALVCASRELNAVWIKKSTLLRALGAGEYIEEPI